jgi:RNA polymerase sigma-70 factor (ECF subfamily)
MSQIRTNEEWLQDLNARGSLQESAIAELRDLLLRAALYFFSRNLGDFGGLGRDEILDHLPDFRGDSKFSTWAYKFAINIALMAARHERWKGVSLDELDSSTEGTVFEWLMEDKTDNIAPEQSAMCTTCKGSFRM